MSDDLVVKARRGAQKAVQRVLQVPRELLEHLKVNRRLALEALATPVPAPSPSINPKIVSCSSNVLKRDLSTQEVPALADLKSPWSTILEGLAKREFPGRIEVEKNPPSSVLKWKYPDTSGDINISLSIEQSRPPKLNSLFLKRKLPLEREFISFYDLQANEIETLYPGLRAALVILVIKSLTK